MSVTVLREGFCVCHMACGVEGFNPGERYRYAFCEGERAGCYYRIFPNGPAGTHYETRGPVEFGRFFHIVEEGNNETRV